MKFDIVIGNPPYGTTAGGCPDWASHLNKAAGKVSEGGYLCFLIPSQWRVISSYKMKSNLTHLNGGSFVSCKNIGMFYGHNVEVDIVVWKNEPDLDLTVELECGTIINAETFKMSEQPFPIRDYDLWKSLTGGADKLEFVGVNSDSKFDAPSLDKPMMILNATKYIECGVLYDRFHNCIYKKCDPVTREIAEIGGSKCYTYGDKIFGDSSYVLPGDLDTELVEFFNSETYKRFFRSMMPLDKFSAARCIISMEILNTLSASSIKANWKSIESELTEVEYDES